MWWSKVHYFASTFTIELQVRPQVTTILFNNANAPKEFLEQTGIVKYPPPLYVYAWKELDRTERQIALKELQNINKEHVLSVLEAKTGKMHAKFGKSRGKDEPKEWRAWSKGERGSIWKLAGKIYAPLDLTILRYTVPNSHLEIEKGIRARRNHTAVWKLEWRNHLSCRWGWRKAQEKGETYFQRQAFSRTREKTR